jgi:integrase
MKRIKDEKRIKTPELRKRLAPGRIHWEDLGNGGHLGYRRGGGAGQWLGRAYLGDGQYRQEVIGGADDGEHLPDAVDIFDYFQARTRAHEWLRETKNKAKGLPAAGGDLTVLDALQSYVTWLEGRGGGRGIRSRVLSMIAPSLGDIQVRELRQTNVEQWLSDTAAAPARLRNKRNSEPRYADTDLADPEVVRRRRSNANRVLNILKAALNRCWRQGLVPSNEAWARIPPFRGAGASRVRYLLPDEALRLVRAAVVESPDFARLAQVALVSGGRYGELGRLRVEDFSAAAGTLHVRLSKSGKSRHVILGPEGVELLRGFCAGRRHHDLILTNNGGPWIRNAQVKPMKAACLRAGLKPMPFHCLRHSWASNAAMNGMALMLIAKNLGHSTTQMVEKHYAHLAKDYQAREISRLAPTFGFAPGKIAPISGDRRRA